MAEVNIQKLTVLLCHSNEFINFVSLYHSISASVFKDWNIWNERPKMFLLIEAIQYTTSEVDNMQLGGLNSKHKTLLIEFFYILHFEKLNFQFLILKCWTIKQPDLFWWRKQASGEILKQQTKEELICFLNNAVHTGHGSWQHKTRCEPTTPSHYLISL